MAIRTPRRREVGRPLPLAAPKEAVASRKTTEQISTKGPVTAQTIRRIRTTIQPHTTRKGRTFLGTIIDEIALRGVATRNGSTGSATSACATSYERQVSTTAMAQETKTSAQEAETPTGNGPSRVKAQDILAKATSYNLVAGVPSSAVRTIILGIVPANKGPEGTAIRSARRTTIHASLPSPTRASTRVGSASTQRACPSLVDVQELGVVTAAAGRLQIHAIVLVAATHPVQSLKVRLWTEAAIAKPIRDGGQ